MQEGMARIRYELGPDAVIIDRRKKRQRGLMGWFLPRIIEITAAVDEAEKKEPPREPKEKKRDLHPEKDALKDEIMDLKRLVGEILSHHQDEEISQEAAFWQQQLQKQDVFEKTASEIVLQAQNKVDKSESVSLSDQIYQEMIKKISTDTLPEEAKYIAFVGPTGVGKTTTLAKLAANWAFQKKKKVAILTLDTYRIGAVEQLKKYADIADIPLKTVLSKDELKEAKDELEGYDTVFVDTAGRSPESIFHIHETNQYIKMLPGLYVCLVMSAATKSSDIDHILQAYRNCDYESLIITKMDETKTYGMLLNCCLQSHRPVVYVTNGQNVPEDIQSAEAGKLTDLIMGDDSDD